MKPPSSAKTGRFGAASGVSSTRSARNAARSSHVHAAAETRHCGLCKRRLYWFRCIGKLRPPPAGPVRFGTVRARCRSAPAGRRALVGAFRCNGNQYKRRLQAQCRSLAAAWQIDVKRAALRADRVDETPVADPKRPVLALDRGFIVIATPFSNRAATKRVKAFRQIGLARTPCCASAASGESRRFYACKKYSPLAAALLAAVESRSSGARPAVLRRQAS